MRKVKDLSKPQWQAPDVLTKTIPAPIEGWDAISPLAAMDPKRAPILQNWVPRPGWIELRAGYTVQNLLPGSAPVESLFVWRPPSGIEKLFAAADGSIYDVTTPGLTPAVVTGDASARWQYVQFTVPAAPADDVPVLQLVNGVDALRQYDGTTWSTPAITGLPGGRTSADIINISAQKNRLWYVLKNSTVASYMFTSAISGAIAGSQDLGPQWTEGGYLVAIATWTIDGGNGPGDYVAFISSKGQISLFSGTDPTSSTAWTLVGTFKVAPPIGLRCTCQLGSDVGLITQQGVLPLSQVLPFDPAMDRSSAVTSRIQNAMAQAASDAQANFGWQLITFPMQQLLFLNVPLEENAQQQQYVQNLITGAWCSFTGWNANVFEIWDNQLVWGGNDGYINLGYQTGLDLVSPIQAEVQCAYNWFDDPGRNKRATMIQPLLTASGTITPLLAVDADFATSALQAPISTLTGGALWGSSSLKLTAATPVLSLVTVSPSAAGSGYQVNDLIILTGGTFSGAGQVKVTGIDGSGGVTSASVSYGGIYSSIAATLTQGATTGTGTGATFTSTSSDGSGYNIGDTITLGVGTFTTAAVLIVSTVNGSGGVTSATVSVAGIYSDVPFTMAQTATSGAGIGATFTPTLAQALPPDPNVGIWDTSLWPGGTMSLTAWYSTTALGHALAVHMYVNIGASGAGSNVGEFDIGTFDSATFDTAVASIAPLLRINAFNAIMEFGAFI